MELLRAEAAFLIAPVLVAFALHFTHLADGVRATALVLLCLCAAGAATGFPLQRTLSGRPVAAYPKTMRPQGSTYFPYQTRWYQVRWTPRQDAPPRGPNR